LNKLMQGPEFNTLTQNDKVNTFMKKLELWKRNVTLCHVYYFLKNDPTMNMPTAHFQL